MKTKRNRKINKNDIRNMIIAGSIGIVLGKLFNGDMTLDVAKKLLEITSTENKDYYDDSELRI